MQPTNGNIRVRFDPLPTTAGGLILPERYLIQEADKEGEIDAYGIVTDRRLINPQTVTLLSGEYDGQKAFVYYGSYEIQTKLPDGTGLIPERTVYFLLEPIRMLDGFHLGTEVFVEGERTESGIYVTPYAEQKEGVKIKLTHVFEGSPYQVGDTVVTIDPYQYTLTYEGQKYVKLLTDQIIGVEKDGEYTPTGETLLIEYIDDDDRAERTAENDRRRAKRDFIDKMGIFYSKEHAEGRDEDLGDIKEPATVRSKVISMGGFRYGYGIEVGDELLVLRNYGCALPNKQWIVNMDTIIGVIDNGNKEISGHA